MIVSAGTSYFADLVTADNGVTISGGSLLVEDADELISGGDLTLSTG